MTATAPKIIDLITGQETTPADLARREEARHHEERRAYARSLRRQVEAQEMHLGALVAARWKRLALTAGGAGLVMAVLLIAWRWRHARSQ